MAGDFDIREACPNRVRYLNGAVNAPIFKYPDVDVVDNGVELGPCVYRTIFRMAVSNPEDNKAVALAIARINEYIRDVKARLDGYGWEIFEKETYIEEGYVYVEVKWMRRVRIPGKKYVSLMEIYELALPHIEKNLRESAEFFELLRGGSEAVAEAQ
jgi:hypothetical protein